MLINVLGISCDLFKIKKIAKKRNLIIFEDNCESLGSKLKDKYFGEYFYLPLSTLKMIKQHTSKKIAVMLNAKDCNEIDVVNLLKDTTKFISLVRLATDPNEIEFSLKLAKKLKTSVLKLL